MVSEEQPLTFQPVLFFCTEMDRIPPYGLTQKIEVEFKDVPLPWASTCGLHLILPTVDIKRKLVIAVNFGGDFGKILLRISFSYNLFSL